MKEQDPTSPTASTNAALPTDALVMNENESDAVITIEDRVPQEDLDTPVDVVQVRVTLDSVRELAEEITQQAERNRRLNEPNWWRRDAIVGGAIGFVILFVDKLLDWLLTKP